MQDIEVVLDKCTGCKLCIKACLYGAIEVVDKKAIIKDNCNLCGACVEACKYEAILIKVQPKISRDKDQYRGLWVFAEQRNGEISPVVFELLGEGRKLADELRTELSALLIGANIEKKAEELIQAGADKVYLTDDPVLKDVVDEVYAAIIVDLIGEYKPEIVLAGATALGRSLIPRVASILETGLTADCTVLAIEGTRKLLLQTRPAFGGNIMATIICPEKRPQMATVRPHVMKKPVRDESRRGEVIKKSVNKEKLSWRIRVLDFIEDITEKVELEEAEIIVSGGRGLGKAENFKIIQELANVLGAAVGASRAAVDAGWIPYSHQVGQTGKTVCPKLYVACGISGAIQHLAGMQTSDVIVAINKDSSAPIFQVATYGIVGDLFEVVPALTTKFKEVLAK